MSFLSISLNAFKTPIQAESNSSKGKSIHITLVILKGYINQDASQDQVWLCWQVLPFRIWMLAHFAVHWGFSRFTASEVYKPLMYERHSWEWAFPSFICMYICTHTYICVFMCMYFCVYAFHIFGLCIGMHICLHLHLCCVFVCASMCMCVTVCGYLTFIFLETSLGKCYLN